MANYESNSPASQPSLFSQVSGAQPQSPSATYSNSSGEGSRAGIHPSTFGPAYSPALDGERIAKQHEVIRDFMLRSGWKTLAEIEQALGYPQASVSAQLRHLRKTRFGSYQVEKRRRSDSQWEYAVTKGTTK
jgi:hypothetical protein